MMATAEAVAMTLEQTAQYLQVPQDDLREWLEAGELPGTRLPSGEWRVPRPALEEWLNRRARLNLRNRGGSSPRIALRQARELREQILRDRNGEPFPEGFGVQAVREARERE